MLSIWCISFISNNIPSSFSAKVVIIRLTVSCLVMEWALYDFCLFGRQFSIRVTCPFGFYRLPFVTSPIHWFEGSDKIGYRQSLRQDYVRCLVTQRSCQPSASRSYRSERRLGERKKFQGFHYPGVGPSERRHQQEDAVGKTRCHWSHWERFHQWSQVVQRHASVPWQRLLAWTDPIEVYLPRWQ